MLSRKVTIDEEGKNNRFFNSFNTEFDIRLNDEQKEVILNQDDILQVIGGAGTGKTTTLVAKARYLNEVKGVKSSEILCLSFSRKSAEELGKKVNKDIHYPKIPVKTTTFHDLGLEILRDNDRRKHALNEEDNEKLRSIFRKFIIRKICKDFKKGSFYTFEMLKIYFPHFFNPGFFRKKGWKEDVLIKNKGDYDYDYNSFNKDRVKSIEDLKIADFLYFYGIDYKYLKKKEFGNKKVQFDFYLPKYGIYIDDQRYDEEGHLYNLNESESRIYKSKKNYQGLIEDDKEVLVINTFLHNENYLLSLKEDLKNMGVEFNKKYLSYKEIEKKLKQNTFLEHLDDLVDYFLDFVKMFKQHDFSEEDFKKFNARKGREKFFVRLVSDYYSYYQNYLKINHLADFSDMIVESTKIMDKSNLSYDYILIDEFQELSKIRLRFLKKLLEKTQANLIVVGDDWQSIYGFNGCEVKCFSQFHKCLQEKQVKQKFLNRTCRYSKELLNISIDFISFEKKLFSSDKLIPKPNLYSNKSLKKPLEYRAILVRDQEGNKKYKEDASKKLLYDVLEEISINHPNSSVMILSRYRNRINEIKKIFNKINASRVFNLRIDFFTIHESKGLESDNVILLDVNKNSIPNMYKEESLLRFVSSKDNYKKRETRKNMEERRLFYVALTRTKNKVYLCYINNEISEFVKNLNKNTDFINKENFRADLKYDPLNFNSESIINKFWKYKELLKETNIDCPNPYCRGKLNHYKINNKHFIACSEFKSKEEKKKLNEKTDICNFFIEDIIELMDDFYLKKCKCCKGHKKGFLYHNTLYNYSKEVKTFCSEKSCYCSKKLFIDAENTSQNSLDEYFS